MEARSVKPRHSAFQAWEVVPAVLVLVGFAAWAEGALAYLRPLDFGLAYRAGVAAWDSGHPEQLRTWMSTPVLAAVMAIVSRVAPLSAAIVAMTVLNLGLTVGLLAVVGRGLRDVLPRAAWWGSLAVAALFTPLISTVLFKQFNLVVLVLGVAGFAAVRRGHHRTGAALTALGLCLKPIAVLTPFAFLAWRDTRKAGAWTILWGAGLTAAAQLFLAWRAADAAVLNPLPAFATFSKRTAPWVCHEENFSPRGMLCRLAGDESWPLGPVFALAGVLLLMVLAREALRGYEGRSWETYAFVCLLSPMLGPVAWTHYQLFLAPMLLVLVRGFAVRGAHWTLWAGLLFSVGLASLVVRPFGTIPGGIEFLLSGRDNETLKDAFRVMAVSQFAQYFLFLVACRAVPAFRAAS